MYTLRSSTFPAMLLSAQGSPGVATSLSRGTCNDTEARIEEGTQVALWYPLLLRAHRAPGSRRPIPQAGTARRLSGRMGG